MTPTLWRKTWRDLRAAWAQSLALLLIVALGVASLVALTGAYRDLGSSYHHTYESLHFADVTFRVTAAPATVADSLARLDGVAAVTPRLVVDTGYLLPDGTPIRARLISFPPGRQPEVNQVHLLEGHLPTASDTDGVLVESHFAHFYHLHPGDVVTPLIAGREYRFTVRGVVASPEYLIVSPSRQEILPSARTFGVFFVPQPVLQEAMHAPGEVNEFCLLLKPEADAEAVIQEAADVLAPYHLEATTRQKDQPSNAALSLDLEGYRQMGETMPLLMLLVAAMALYVMLGRMVRGQRTQIGLMKAIGRSNCSIVTHYLVMALAIAGGGALLGAAIGTLLARLVATTYARELGIPLLQIHRYPDLILLGLALSLGMAAPAAWGPARSTTHLQPAQAMRFDPAHALSNGRRLWVERLLPANLPVHLRLPLRNVFRARRRAFSTWLSITFAMMLLLATFGMLDSMNTMLDRYFHTIERWDLQVIFTHPQTATTLERIRHMPGVEEAVPATLLPATLQTAAGRKEILLTALPADQDVRGWDLVDGITPQAALADGGILITPALAQALGLQRGDTVQVKTPFGVKEATVRAFSNELYGTMAFVDSKTLQAWTGAPNTVFNLVYIKADPPQWKTLKKSLFRLPGAALVQIKADAEQDWRQFMGLFYLFLAFLIAFAVGMAFAVLFNAMTVNILERQRELATMRALGAPIRLLGRMVALESVLLWLLALPFGLGAGWYITQAMITGFSTELFSMSTFIAPRSYILTAGAILLTMLLASLPAIQRIARLDLAAATKMTT